MLQNEIPIRSLRSLKKGFNAWAGKRSSDTNEFSDRIKKLKELTELQIEELPIRQFYEFLKKQQLKNAASDD